MTTFRAKICCQFGFYPNLAKITYNKKGKCGGRRKCEKYLRTIQSRDPQYLPTPLGIGRQFMYVTRIFFQIDLYVDDFDADKKHTTFILYQNYDGFIYSQGSKNTWKKALKVLKLSTTKNLLTQIKRGRYKLKYILKH